MSGTEAAQIPGLPSQAPRHIQPDFMVILHQAVCKARHSQGSLRTRHALSLGRFIVFLFTSAHWTRPLPTPFREHHFTGAASRFRSTLNMHRQLLPFQWASMHEGGIVFRSLHSQRRTTPLQTSNLSLAHDALAFCCHSPLFSQRLQIQFQWSFQRERWEQDEIGYRDPIPTGLWLPSSQLSYIREDR